MVQTNDEKKEKARKRANKWYKENKARTQTPEYKAKLKARRDKPENKAKLKARTQTPEYKARDRKWRASSEHKAKLKVRRDKPENKARRKATANKPENKAKAKARKQTPEYKAKARDLKQKPHTKMRAKELRDKYRLKVLHYYSKLYSKSIIPCCRCCGEKSHIDFLAVDHIIGRKEMDSEPKLIELGYSSTLSGEALSRWIIQNNFPKGFQILCHNCNYAKGIIRNNNICPHKQ